MAHARLIDGDFIFSPPPTVTLKNLLPFDLVVILFQGEFGKGKFLPFANLGPYQEKTLKSPGTSYETKIAAMKSQQSASLLTNPIYYARGDSRQPKYYFGSVTWNSTEMDTNIYNLYADIPGLRIYNHFPFEVTIRFRNLIFKVPSKGWRNYVGGSPGIVYFDNQGSGLAIGDVFLASISGPSSQDSIKLMEFKIPNRLVKNIHLGSTSTAT